MQEIQYKLKRFRRAKYMRIIIHQDGSVVVTAPFRAAKREIEKFVKDKQEWIKRGVEAFKNSPVPIVRKPSRKEYLRYKEQARKYIIRRLEELNKEYEYPYNRVSIRNQKTCWGSCSSKRNLNFNYRILFLPSEQADYIITHELCHLKEMNHSPRFWKLVEKTIPNYREIKRELRKNEMIVG